MPLVLCSPKELRYKSPAVFVLFQGIWQGQNRPLIWCVPINSKSPLFRWEGNCLGEQFGVLSSLKSCYSLMGFFQILPRMKIWRQTQLETGEWKPLFPSKSHSWNFRCRLRTVSLWWVVGCSCGYINQRNLYNTSQHLFMQRCKRKAAKQEVICYCYVLYGIVLICVIIGSVFCMETLILHTNASNSYVRFEDFEWKFMMFETSWLLWNKSSLMLPPWYQRHQFLDPSKSQGLTVACWIARSNLETSQDAGCTTWLSFNMAVGHSLQRCLLFYDI